MKILDYMFGVFFNFIIMCILLFKLEILICKCFCHIDDFTICLWHLNRKLDDTCKFLEAYQDNDALNKVSAIQVAIYTICRVVVQRARKWNSILVMVSSHVKKTFNWETITICNFLNRVLIVNPFHLILPCC